MVVEMMWFIHMNAYFNSSDASTAKKKQIIQLKKSLCIRMGSWPDFVEVDLKFGFDAAQQKYAIICADAYKSNSGLCRKFNPLIAYSVFIDSNKNNSQISMNLNLWVYHQWNTGFYSWFMNNRVRWRLNNGRSNTPLNQPVAISHLTNKYIGNFQQINELQRHPPCRTVINNICSVNDTPLAARYSINQLFWEFIQGIIFVHT